MTACIARATCLSFDYNKGEKSCDLSDSAAGKDGVPSLTTTYSGNPYDYYVLQRVTTAVSTNCTLNFESSDDGTLHV